MKENEALTLLELNTRVKETVGSGLPDLYWIRAETSDVRINASSGHCYLEFVEKDETTAQIAAKARGTIWARTFQIIKPYFEKETGQAFVSGLKVLVSVSVEFHEVYGYSLNVCDIEPSYTLGDMVKKRKEIIQRLQQEGLFDLNQTLPFPRLPQRIAVVTSPTAAGYEDFTNQLLGNQYGYPFYVKLFPATMQGEKTEESIIAALDKIFSYQKHFDAVVIIRGGGSASELNCFDSYPLAAHCAQFPLPVITGIGHERDDTIVDLVAHTRLKTPTAVASFLIECMNCEAEQLFEFQQIIVDGFTACIAREKAILQLITAKLPLMAAGSIEQHRNRLQNTMIRLSALPAVLRYHKEHVESQARRLHQSVAAVFKERRRSIEMTEQCVKMASPEYILRQGYTLVFKDGKIVKQAGVLAAGDEFTIKFADGKKKGLII